MKKSVLVLSMTVLIALGGLNMAIAQEQPSPKKDTVNIDTEAKPTFYYAAEDEKTGSESKGSGTTIAIIAGAVVVVAAAGFLLLKKKK